MSQPAQSPRGRVPDAPNPEVLRDSRRAGLLLVTGALLGMLDFPRNLVAVVALLPALFFFFRTLRAQAGRAPLPTVLWTALGFVLTSMLLVGALAPLLFLDATVRAHECNSAANTLQALDDCRAQLPATMEQITQR